MNPKCPNSILNYAGCLLKVKYDNLEIIHCYDKEMCQTFNLKLKF